MKPRALAAAVAAAGALAATAAAGVTPSGSAGELASALASNSSLVTGASFVTRPPSGSPTAVADSGLAGFPTSGSTYVVLSTGDAAAAAADNTSESLTGRNGGGHVRGSTDYDVIVLRVDLAVPAGADCLSLDFRFLTEEYPEYVGRQFNDVFIAELDESSWREEAGVVTAPANFAFDPSGNPISVNAAGATSVDREEASGTTYDGATDVLTASTPVTPGAHALYLSLADIGDESVDSAVFVDRLTAGKAAGGECARGAATGGGAAGAPGTCESPSDCERTGGYVGLVAFVGAGMALAAAFAAAGAFGTGFGGAAGAVAPPVVGTSRLRDFGFGTRSIDGKRYVVAPGELPKNVRAAAFHTRSVRGVEVVDESREARVEGDPVPEGERAFRSATEGTLDYGSPPGAMVLPDSVGNALQFAVEEALPTEALLQDAAGSLVVEEAIPGADALGLVHAHVYGAEEGGYINVAFSGGDFAAMLGRGLNVVAVQSGPSRFVAVRTAQTPSAVDLAAVRESWRTAFRGAREAGAAFADAVFTACVAVAREQRLLLYHGLGDAELTLVQA